MNNIGIVVGILAMFVAMGAIFFASTAMKKVESSTEDFVRSHVDPVVAQIADIRKTMNETAKQTNLMQKDVEAFTVSRERLENSLSEIEERLDNLKIQRSTPATKNS
jgi:septal ring factor EnvC (AmiA/AmiB activator)